MNHTSDSEMWARILNQYKGTVLNEILASRRDFGDSDTKSVRKSRQEVIDYPNTIYEISNVYKIDDISLENAIKKAR